MIDELIEQLVSAETLEELKAINRAMDRVLLWNYYAIPQFYNDIYRIAYWNKFAHPETFPKYSTGFPSTWWIEPDLDAKLSQR